MNNNFNKICMCLKPFLNGLSIFSGILFLGLMSCSTAADSTSSSPTKDKTPPTYTISFKLNGGSFISSQITNLKVVTNTAIEETKLEKILSYPPTGPKPSIQAVTRGIFEWRTNGTKYELSTPVSSDLTLEAVWSNSCGKVETFHPSNRDELQNYVDAAVGSNSTTNLNHIDTSAITDMNNLFRFKNSFNGKIDCWNTAKVNNMGAMFLFANVFNQDINSWNVANVNNMEKMFNGARAFNRDIGSWNVSNVTNMDSMFNNANAFNGDISSWNVANVNNMSSMFRNANAFNGDISSWNVANVTSMNGMFSGASAFSQDISSWNVANVNNMSGMFSSATAFNEDIGSWNVSNVNNMSWMFYAAYTFNQDISSWNVANVTTMESMFSNATAFNQDLSKWSVSNVSKHDNMFTDSAMESETGKHPRFLDKTHPTVTISTNKSLEIDIPGTITFTFSEEVTNFTPDDIQLLINGVNVEKGSFITNNLTNYSLDITPKAIGTLSITIPINSFEDLSGNQSAKEYTSNFEVHPPSYTISFKLNGGSFISPQITNLKVISNEAIEQARLGEILSYPTTGTEASRDIFEWQTNGIKYDFSTLVSSDLTLEAVWSNSCGEIETFHPTNRSELQNYVDNALRATNLNHVDTSAITNMYSLVALRSDFNGKIDCWNTSKVTDMSTMFVGASAFNQDIGNWNVVNVTDMEAMFNGASAFNQDLSSWSVSNVTNHNAMFYGSAMASKTNWHPNFQ